MKRNWVISLHFFLSFFWSLRFLAPVNDADIRYNNNVTSYDADKQQNYKMYSEKNSRCVI